MINPWNAPLLFALRALAPALVPGNAVHFRMVRRGPAAAEQLRTGTVHLNDVSAKDAAKGPSAQSRFDRAEVTP
ncbi:hypothetical protein ACIRPU_39400 [Streptomyces sp. NPDC102259]|uniref:hypothetical protein n=1 Tax=Streptomyces sp. NPDC102259 TaxID=3366148 RepID=UPI003830C0BF